MAGSAKFTYLVEAVVFIAVNAKPNAVRGPEICTAQGLPPRYLEADLQKLVRQGILKSVRGPRGGYVLAKERRNITLADIYAGVEKEEVPAKVNANVVKALKTAEDLYVEELAKITIESLAAQGGFAPVNKQKSDFTI